MHPGGGLARKAARRRRRFDFDVGRAGARLHTMMKAIRVEQFGEPEVMQLAEIPVPQPGPGQVVVRIHAAGVNPVDTYVRSGVYARKPALPFTPGMDGAGTIEAMGADVAGLTSGARVFVAGSVSGTYAPFALCEAARVHGLPDRVSFAQGAALGVPYTTAWRALHQRGQAQAGETVLVHGASGGTGMAAVQLARAAGLRVLGTAGTERGRALLTAQGAEAVFNHHAPDYLEKIRAATDGRGVNLILEMLANVNLAADLTLLAPRGRIVVIGSRGSVEITPREIMARDADIRGMMIFNATPDELAATYAGIGAGLASGALQPVVGREFPLAQAAEAHRAVMAPGAYGKIVLVP